MNVILMDGRDIVGKEREKPVVDGDLDYKCNL